MDKMTVVGIVLALVAVLGGSVLKGSGIASLWSPAAFVIVIIGTIAAISLHTPLATLKHALKILKWTVFAPTPNLEREVERIVEWSSLSRKQGLLALESIVESEPDAFIKKALQMLVDGTEPETIRGILEVEVSAREHHDLTASKVYEGMGIYAPTLGIIGAVLGLMAVMKNLADPSKLGVGIAAAFVATIYGIAFANLFFLPVSAKLKAIINEQSRHRELLIEGIVAIAKGENPRNIEQRLAGFISH
tara:strand:+ start:267 stop:1010 length:744 start_codon:yes stop_codon:yes gene_type:complete